MGRVMHSTADEMRLMGHTVDMLFSEDVPRFRRGASDRFVFPVALVRAVLAAIRERGQYDVVEIHEPSAAWYCHVRRYDKSLPPCVVMSHGIEEAQWKLRLRLDRLMGIKTSRKSLMLVPLTLLSQVRYSLKRCQQIMCLNSYDENYLRNIIQIPIDRISRVDNGVSPIFFSKEDEIKRNNKSLLFAGGWLRRKGVQTLVEAFQRIHLVDNEISLSLIGTGMSEQEVKSSFPPELWSSLNIIPSVCDQQLKEAYSSHSIFVFPSYFEPWGLVLMEAAAAGIAIVSTCTGGPSDLFQDGENALLVPATDPIALSDAVTKLIADPQLRLQLGKKAQERARQFTWSAAAHSHLIAYERAIKNEVRP